MSEKCPVCDGKMMDQGIFGKSCPLHGKYDPNIEGLSKPFYDFLENINNLEFLVLSLKYLDEHKNKAINKWKEYGYSNPEEMYYKRLDGLIDINNKSEIVLMKAFIDNYSIEKGYKDTKQFYNQFNEIQQKRKIKFQRGSKEYNPLNLLKAIRDYIIHSGRNLKDDAKEIIDIKLPEFFLKDPIRIVELRNGTKEIEFLHDLSKEEMLETLQTNEYGPISKLRSLTFIDYLREEVINTIRDIEIFKRDKF